MPNVHMCRFSLSKIFGMVSGVFSVVVLVWLDVKDGRGGVTGGGEIHHNCQNHCTLLDRGWRVTEVDRVGPLAERSYQSALRMSCFSLLVNYSFRAKLYDYGLESKE